MPVDGTTQSAQVAGMSDRSSQSAAAELADALPNVELEVRHGGRSTLFVLSHVDFLIGTVPGCDLRVPGADLPPVLCLLARRPGGLALRKLAPTQLLLVNGATVSHANLADGDRVTLGAMDIFVRVKISVNLPSVDSSPHKQSREVGSDFDVQAADLENQREELASKRQELADIRRQLYERYQERRDRLAGLQEAVDRAARKIQERKRQLDADELEAQRRRQEDAARRQELEDKSHSLEERARCLEEERRLLADSHAAAQAEAERQLADVQTREAQLASAQQDLERRLRQYQADLVRLDRLHGTLDEREQKLQQQSRDLEAHLVQLQSDSADLEEQVARLDEWRLGMQEESERLARQKVEQDAAGADLAQRAAAVEGQQATLAALRTRVERAREELRVQEQQLDEERLRQDVARQEADAQRQALARLRGELDGTQQLCEQERRQLAERSAVLDTAVSQLRQAQEKLAEQEKTMQEKAQDLDRRAAVLSDQEGVVQGRLQQLSEAQERLDLERQALRERTQALTQTELAREGLQEQLRKRSEELTARHKALTEKMQAYETQAAALEAHREEVERRHQETQAQHVAWQQEQAAHLDTVQAHQHELGRREDHHREQYEQLRNLGREIAAERKALADERTGLRQEQEAWLEAQAQKQAEFNTLRQEAIGLARQLPDVELRAGTALERLTHAREQLRDHLAELHAYTQECRDDLETSQRRLQQEEIRVQEQEQALRRSQEEHRLAMVAFRQQMIGWQGQIVDLKRLLAKDETRLEQRQAQVEEQAKEVGAASEKLAQEAEALQQQQHAVAGQRQEMDRHLVDMREWYRHKLRELAGIDEATAVADGAPAASEVVTLPLVPESDSQVSHGETADQDLDDALIPTGRNILSLTEPVDAGDRTLGDMLIDLELIDRGTLNALLVDARRQRRSLRQVLLASGVVTLYQLALIEAGNVAGLVLGTVRVIDRLRITPHETVYRVFDPRRSCEGVLRHLSEATMQDAVRPDEFRQRFTQAMIASPHVTATLEVLDIDGRPAVLQEWLSGVPSSDWPPLAAAPGVCFRLFTQAALGLDALHKAGLVHGSLDEACIFLTSEGVLKISSACEPVWLRGAAAPEESAEPRDDLQALGRIVSVWCTPTGVRKGGKTKPLPEALVAILFRLAPEGAAGYTSAAELLEDLERASSDVPANAEAWERLLRHVREHATSEAVVRRSA